MAPGSARIRRASSRTSRVTPAMRRSRWGSRANPGVDTLSDTCGSRPLNSCAWSAMDFDTTANRVDGAWPRSEAGKHLGGPEEPLEPLAPSPYASVIYSAPRTRSKVGPERPSVHRVDQSLRRFAKGSGDFCRLRSILRGPWVPPPSGLSPFGSGALPGETPGPPSGLGRLGPARKVARGLTLCQTPQKHCRTMILTDFRR